MGTDVLAEQKTGPLQYFMENSQDILLVFSVILISILVSFPDGTFEWIDRKYLLGALTGILIVGMMKHMQWMLVLLMCVIVGAIILPDQVLDLGVDSSVLALALSVLVVISVLHKLIAVPKWLDPNMQSGSFIEKLHGVHAMSAAIHHNRLGSVRALIRQGIEPNTLLANGDTPLIAAIKRENAHIVQLLLANGASATLPCGEGLTPMTHARQKQCKLIEALLRHAGAAE